MVIRGKINIEYLTSKTIANYLLIKSIYRYKININKYTLSINNLYSIYIYILM